MRILITGILGFVGSHLAEYCLAKGDVVIGTMKTPNDKFDNLLPQIRNQVAILECELTDYKNVLDVIKETNPDIIFHLAAQSFVPTSWKSPSETIVNNAVSQINILEAVRKLNLNPVIHVACSSEEYGLVKENELPIKETNPLRPLSPYAVSKVTQEMLAYQYHQNYGLRIVITRAFNHEGPRRGTQFVTADFAKQLADLPAAGGDIIVGNLDSFRDYTDVRDVVRAYYEATTNKNIKYGEPYNICSGQTWQIRRVLEVLIKISGKKVNIIQDPKRLRPSDVQRLQGDFSKFHLATGWQPSIDFNKTLQDIYQYFVDKKLA